MFERSVQSNRIAKASVAPQAHHCPQELLARLEALRVEPAMIRSRQGFCAGGLPLRVTVAGTIRSAAAMDRLLRTMTATLADSIPVTLSIAGLAGVADPVATFERFCSIAARTLRNGNVDPALIGMSLNSRQLPLASFSRISRSILGDGPRYMIVDGLEMRWQQSDQVRETANELWEELWRLQDADELVLPAYGGFVSSDCPLLADEVAHSILPAHAIQVPGDSAWLPVRLRLTDFSGGNGEIDWKVLIASLHGAIEIGGILLDGLNWPSRAQARDAVSNRRLAIILNGLGDLVCERKMDPADLATLRWLQIVMSNVRRALWDASGELARHDELLPALADTDPSKLWSDSTDRNDWYLRWWRSIHQHAVANRNLLVMSPYSVLPEQVRAGPECIDLLPVISHADAFAFSAARPLIHWNVNEFKKFHRRAWAIMQQSRERSASRNDASFVAAGV